MLSYLRIRQLAILEDVAIEPGAGLNVLTGETGAGKSVLVDALGLILGGRAETSMVRSGSERLIVEAQFDLEGRPDIASRAAEAGLDLDLAERELVIRREVAGAGTSGKGRVTINGRLATLGELKTLGEALADLHGQHQHQSLLTARGQREALDAFALNNDALQLTRERALLVRDLTREREMLAALEADRARVEDDCRSRIAEIESVDPAPGEDSSLAAEESLLRNTAEVTRLSSEAFALVSDDDGSALARLGAAAERASRLAGFDPRADAIRTLLEESRLAAAEAARSLARYCSLEDFSPERLEIVAARLAVLDRIKRRFGPSLPEVLEALTAARETVAGLDGADERRSQLSESLASSWRAYLDACGDLSARRKRAAARLQVQVAGELSALAMEGARVTLQIRAGDPAVLSAEGQDAIEFLIAANPGEEPRPLARVASGGELSRLMLALRNAGGPRGDKRTLIFDEVDSGVGGRVAEAVGQRLRALADSQQVFCVTHLPQIAAFADRHFLVNKRAQGGRTVAGIEHLEMSGRVAEIARMLGGVPPDSARRHAEALLTMTASSSMPDATGKSRSNRHTKAVPQGGGSAR